MSDPSLRLRLEAVFGFRRARREVRGQSVGELVEALQSRALGARGADVEAILEAHRRAVHGRLGGGTSTCLPRAYALTRLLRDHGHDAQLVIGVRPTDLGRRGLEDGHAWVESGGVPLDEPEGKIDGYLEFLRAPGPPGPGARP